MKKYILLCIMIITLISCGSNEQLDQAKQELLGNTLGEDEPNTRDTTQESQADVTENQSETSRVRFEDITQQQFIRLNDISQSDISSEEIELAGITLADVNKIEVYFSNASSDFSDDAYTLQTFNPGDKEFRYIASTRNKVLDLGVNTYIFKAYSDNPVPSQTRVTVTLGDARVSQSEQLGSESSLIGTEDNFININFPVSSSYGEPVKLGETSFTYSDINGLEVEKRLVGEAKCEGLTEYLQESINTWFYWNTCRDIVKDEGIKFNVIRLQGEDYVYERHYIDFKNGLYGVYELEVGGGVTSENIADKNTELKEKEYPSLEIVDTLMKDIVNS